MSPSIDQRAGIIERTWWSHLSDFSLLEGAVLEEKAGYTRIVNDIPSSFPNVVFGVDLDPAGVEVRIVEALVPFQDRGLPLNWWIGPTTRPPDLADHLLAQGLEQSLSLAGMDRGLDDLPRDLPQLDGVVFKEVTDPEGLSQRLALMGRAYGIDPAYLPHFQRMYTGIGYGPGAKWRHLAGYLGSRLVVAASIQLHPEAAVLHNVGTDPRFRRLGLATAATLAVLDLAREEGLRRVALQATGAGAGLYEGLGFETVCELVAFSPVSEDGSGIWQEPVRVDGADPS